MYSVLVSCPLFRGLAADKIEEMLRDRQFSVDNYVDGDLIAQRDVAYSGLLIILKGKVRGEVEDSSGKKSKIDNIEAPQLIAPAFLFGGYNRLPIDVIAEGDVSILTLHRGLIFELMQENNIILSNFIDIISNRANMLTKKIYFLSFRSIKEKLANYLIEKTSSGYMTVEISDMNELAECFDAPRSSIITVISDMCKHDIIEYNGDKIVVKNRDILKTIFS